MISGFIGEGCDRCDCFGKDNKTYNTNHNNHNQNILLMDSYGFY